MKVIINGKQRDIDNAVIDYISAAALVHPGKPDVLYTVTWKRPDGTSGSLGYGQRVSVVEGMVINVMTTNRA